MRNVLVLGSLLCALFVTGCDNGVFVADLKCGKDGKLRGELELILLGDEDTQAEIDNASCEDLKEAKKDLKQIKLAIGKECDEDFKPVVFSRKYEIEDENCDGYLDISYEFNVRKLVRAGLLDKDTEELLVGVYIKDEESCEWELVDAGYFPVISEEEWEEESGCEDEEYDCEEEKSYDCEEQTNGTNGNGYGDKDCDKEEQSSYDCDKEKEYKKDCDNNEQPV